MEGVGEDEAEGIAVVAAAVGVRAEGCDFASSDGYRRRPNGEPRGWQEERPGEEVVASFVVDLIVEKASA